MANNILTGDVPYADNEAIRQNNRKVLSIPDGSLSIDAKTAIESMLDINPDTRIELKDLNKLNFFSNQTSQSVKINQNSQIVPPVNLVAPPR